MALNTQDRGLAAQRGVQGKQMFAESNTFGARGPEAGASLPPPGSFPGAEILPPASDPSLGGVQPSPSDSSGSVNDPNADLRNAIRATPLPPELIAHFAERSRAAQRAVMEAEIAGQAGRERSQLDFEQFLRQLQGRQKEAVFDLRGEAAARNLAFQPAFVGVGMRDIRNEVAEAQGQAAQNRAAFLAGIDRQINQATQFRDSELAAIAREQARAQADHQNFINAQLAALG